MSALRVAVLYGGTSVEHEVSVVSARSLIGAMDPAKYDVVPIAISKAGAWLLPGTPPQELPEVAGSLPAVSDEAATPVVLQQGGVLGGGAGGPIDVVFPVLHGPGGEDGTVQGLLETLGIPYVGAGVAASAIGMNKVVQKAVFRQAGIPVVDAIDVRFEEFSGDVEGTVRAAREFIGLPCFAKPAHLGSSVGVSKCTTTAELLFGLSKAFEHDDLAMVERAVSGRELECAILGDTQPEASVVGEIIPANDFYDYEAKYLQQGSKLIIPAEIPEGRAEEVRGYALEAFRAIGCTGMARVDFFLEGSSVLLNEINTIPGFTPISMYPKLWEATGVAYPALIDRLIDLAIQRRKRVG